MNSRTVKAPIRGNGMYGAADYVAIQEYWARFWQAMDSTDYLNILSYLTADCRWLRGAWCEGHENILDSLKLRPGLLVSRHATSNLILDRCEDGYDCRYLLTVYGFTRRSEGDAPPYTITGPRVADYFARLTKVDGEWKARIISAALIFERAASLS